MTDPGSTAGRSARAGGGAGLTFSREAIGDGILMRIHGEIDMATSDILEDAAAEAIIAVVPPAPFVLDMTGVRFLASIGLARLIELDDRCADRGIPLRVVAAHQEVLRPIQITELDRKLTIVPTVEQALHY